MIRVDTSSAHTASALAGKTIVVTGASGHVGWGIAIAALDAGANVVLPVRSETSRAAVERDLGAQTVRTPEGDDQEVPDGGRHQGEIEPPQVGCGGCDNPAPTTRFDAHWVRAATGVCAVDHCWHETCLTC